LDLLVNSLMFSIRSSQSAHEIRFSRQADQVILVELDFGALVASHGFSSCTDELGLVRLLEGLATRSEPWSGERAWASIENDFSVSAICDPLGHVAFVVSISAGAGAEESWQASVTIASEFGQLQSIAVAARQEFAEADPKARAKTRESS
jgi:hypothetical protein